MKTELFVPGRLCLFGEHSDWAGEYRVSDKSVLPGKCIIAGTDQGIYATAESSDKDVQITQKFPGEVKSVTQIFPADSLTLLAAANCGGFNSYAFGTASILLSRFPELSLKLNIYKRDLPLKKGLSSSAATCVLVARAFNKLHSLNLSIEEEMEIAYQGELLAGSKCGRMDQACAYGQGSVLLTFDGDKMDTDKLVVSEPLYFLIVDLNAQKDTIKILDNLNTAFVDKDALLREALGKENHLIVSQASSAIISGDAELLGKLMKDAQNIFDRMVAPSCISELAAPVLHQILSCRAAEKFAFGGKGVGSQGDGTAQFICKGRKERDNMRAILKRDYGLTCYPLTLSPTC